MAERYAMYNVFLGLRFATRSTDYDYGCALTALQQTRAAAEAWNATHEDPDITADLALIDMFIANLEANGGTGYGDSLAQCGADGLYDEGGYYGEHGHHHGCSAGGNPRALVVIALAGVLAVRRRRRK
jgi:MYXO-CTERM domain-containing protein